MTRLAILQARLPADDLRLAAPLDEFAEVMAARGDYESAVTLGLHSARIYDTAHGPRAPKVGLAAERLARYSVKAGEIAKAIGCYDQAVAAKEKNLGPKDPGLLPLLDEYAAMLRGAKLAKEAERIEAKAKAIRSPSPQPQKPKK
jgi:tetratricopeptide (TPR) repeat protein